MILTAQIQNIALQPLMIAVIVITAINLLFTFLVLSRITKAGQQETVQEAAAAAEVYEAPARRRIYANNGNISAEVAAAISAALFLSKNEIHDIESTVLTIDKVAKSYSPWSSKIYGLRKNPR